MCTVTYIPLKDVRYITHSRDEKHLRTRAVPPQLYRQNGRNMLFPKDGQAGGSWLAVTENGCASVLLNGGFAKHTPSPPYRKSRGLVFLDIAASENLPDAWKQISLENIEPFTMLLFNNTELWECRWDGACKYMKLMDASLPHIWSSVTLYDKASMFRRKIWFDKWLAVNGQPSQNDVINFHLSAGDGDQHNNIRMNRDGLLLTVSVSAIRLTPRSGYLRYLDLQAGTQFNQEINFLAANLDSPFTATAFTRNTDK